MSTNTKRVLLAAAALLALLSLGLLIAQTWGGDGDGASVAGGSPSPSLPSPDESPTPENQKRAVREAYLRQWDVYARAVQTLDSSPLQEVFTGDALQAVRREVRDLQQAGLGVRVRVKHNLHIKIADALTAVVIDRYENHSVELDQETGKATERDPNEVILEAYTLKKVDGAWKVSAIDRQSVQPMKP